MQLVLTLFFLLLFSGTLWAQQKELRAAIPDGLAPPLVFASKDGKFEGLVPEYTNALAEALGRKSSLSIITRYRLDGYLQKGKVDVHCYTSPVWAANKEALDFSKPIFIKREVIVGPAPMPKKISGLQGKTVGAMLQYVYPLLDPYFSSGKIKREDSLSEEANLKKLLNGRLFYVVTDEIFLDYFRMAHPEIDKNRERLFMQDYPIACSVSRKGQVSVKELDKAIDQIKSNGKLENIFKKYGASTTK